MRLVLILGLSGFTSAFAIRLVDPMVPDLGRDLSVSLTAAALLSSAFALPYALSQPILGPLGDVLGKARVMKACIALLAVALLASVFAPDYASLFAARLVAGFAGGGIIPLGLAMLGDRFALAERPIAISRFVTMILLGQMAGALFAGVLAAQLGWRAVFLVAAVLAAAALVATLAALPPRRDAVRPPFDMAGILARYRRVFANPNALVCFGAVFTESVAVYGLFPHVAGLLEGRGAGGAFEAGVIIACSGLGGIAYAVVVPHLLPRLGLFGLLRLGGAIAALGLAIAGLRLGLPVGGVAFFVIGLGFFMLHNALQTMATELAPEARGSAVSLHAFSFFVGQASGPAIFALLLPLVGQEGGFALSAAVMAVLGLAVAARFARNARRADAG